MSSHTPTRAQADSCAPSPAGHRLEAASLALLLATVVLCPTVYSRSLECVFELPKAVCCRVLILAALVPWLGACFVRSRDGGDVATMPRWVGWLLAIHVLVLVVATAVSIAPYQSLWGYPRRPQGLLSGLAYLLAFLLAADLCKTRARRNLLAAAIALGSIPVCALGFVELFTAFRRLTPDMALPRMSSTLGNPIFLGGYLVLVIPVTLGAALATVNAVRRHRLIVGTLWGGVLLVQLVCLALTGSRGPWLGFVIGVGVGGSLWAYWHGKRSLLAASCIPLLLLIVLLVTANVPNPLRPLIAWSHYLRRLDFISEVKAGTGQNRIRPLVWRATWRLIDSWPNVGTRENRLSSLRPCFGYGPDSMSIAFQTVFDPRLEDHGPSARLEVDHAHNLILGKLEEIGWVGIATYAALCAAVVSLFLKRMRRTERADQAFGVCLAAALAGHWAEAQFGIALTTSQLLFWTALGMMCVRRRAAGRSCGRIVWGAAGFCALVGLPLFVRAHVQLLRADSHFKQARLLAGRNPAASLDLAEQASAWRPRQSRMYYLRGVICFQQARRLPAGPFREKLLGAAHDLLVSAQSHSPHYANYYAMDARVLAYQAAKQSAERWDAAEAAFGKAIALSPNNVQFRNGLAQVQIDRKQFTRALATLLDSARIDPRCPQTHRLLASVYRKLGDESKALRSEEQLRRLRGGAE